MHYDGNISSPHIKPEFINERLKSPSNMMRAKSRGPDLKQFPCVQGTTIAKQTTVLDSQKSAEVTAKKIAAPFKKECIRNKSSP